MTWPPTRTISYPHFGPPISPADAESLPLDAESIAKHPFYPFLSYTKRWTRFAPRGGQGQIKSRPIKYSAPKDSYIFSYYRHQLSLIYESELNARDLTDVVLAYRKIIHPDRQSGKSSIDFAYEAFSVINSFDSSIAIAVDVRDFFGSLSHQYIKSQWQSLLGLNHLPSDHFHLFKQLTQSPHIDYIEALRRLRYFGPKRTLRNGDIVEGFLIRPLPRPLCPTSIFRKLICGDDGQPSLITRNELPYGIPQGAPLSDLISNFYLLDFDQEMKALADEYNGRYFRYADDILLILQCIEFAVSNILSAIRDSIGRDGRALSINETKTCVVAYSGTSHRVLLGTSGRNGLEYLGFRFCGGKIYLRDRTVSTFHRKIVLTCRLSAQKLARQYPDKSTSELREIVKVDKFISRFGRVENFVARTYGFRGRTFWSYVCLASQIFGPMGRGIVGQVGRHRFQIVARLERELERAVRERSERSGRARG